MSYRYRRDDYDDDGYDYRGRYNRKGNPLLATIIFAIVAGLFVFIIPFESFDCNNNVCHIYEKKGLIGSDKIKEQFRQDEIQSYYIFSHRTKHGKNGSYHDEYKVRLYLKDGRQVVIPHEFCRDKQGAIDLANGIMQGQSYSKR